MSGRIELTPDELQLVLGRRAEIQREKADFDLQGRAIRTAMSWWSWSDEKGAGLTFSTFVNEFGYDSRDCKEMYEAVGRILEAARPTHSEFDASSGRAA